MSPVRGLIPSLASCAMRPRIKSGAAWDGGSGECGGAWGVAWARGLRAVGWG